MSVQDEPGSGIEPASLRKRIVAACLRYENDWRAGRRPAIEDLLEGLSPDERTAVLQELLALEIELRIEGGERPLPSEYTGRFPGDVPTVEEAFALVQTEPVDPPLPTGPLPTTEPTELGPVPDPLAETEPDESGSAPEPIASTEPEEPPVSTRVDAYASTVDSKGPGSNGAAELPPPHRDAGGLRLGRYAVVRQIGKGTFGNVYLARDEDIVRNVAIKVPTARALATPGRLEALLEEARHAAQLAHPGVVAVYDIVRSENGSVFLVFEYVEGSTLAELFREGRVDPDRLAEVVAAVAEATHHAHEKGLVHRDLKPSNILIDLAGRPRVTDFGLAVSGAVQHGRAGEIAGTPSYMAPEQVRGEVHRLSGRTDVWALGVILYLGLTGRLPFPAAEREAIFKDVLGVEPTPPGEVAAGVPRELERICLKCLAKRMADRYGSALDLADELEQWRSGPVVSAALERSGRDRVVPKGLRSFDGGDVDFFLSLLPGPRGRDGLPESVRFWRAWAAETGDGASGVGLLYGPSGAGKSSLVKAGILPRLPDDVRPVYVEASPDGTESRALAALRKADPELDADNLADALALIREGGASPGVKTLLVIDQFEQWLQSHPDDPSAGLVGALRQCDGRRVQALILVRDDFWMAVTRFFKALEVPLVEGANSAPVELFDQDHALGVLKAFGRAQGRLPAAPEEPGPEAQRFLRQAVGEMAGTDGRVSPVRLCLFAEVVRRRNWTPATLRDLGKVGGIGVTFLTETFDSPSAPPSHRAHRKAAEAVLQALLPAPASELRGASRSGRELAAASGYQDRPDDFADLLRILDAELRMITPVDRSLDGPAPEHGGTSYQLAHDYLVGPIRQWLDRKQRATREGRARTRLATITAAWTERPVPRRLPSFWEWGSTLWHTRRASWTADERRMMASATRHTLGRAAVALALAAAAGYGVNALRDRAQSKAVLDRILASDIADVPGLLPEVARHRATLRPALEVAEREPTTPVGGREVVTLLLFGEDPTPGRARVLQERILNAGPDELARIREAFAMHPERVDSQALRAVLHDEEADPARRLRAACVLVGLGDVEDASWTPTARPLAFGLLEEDRDAIPGWVGLLGAAAPLLAPTLGEVCAGPNFNSSRRVAAARVLADVLGPRGDGVSLTPWMLRAQPDAFPVLLEAVEGLSDRSPAIERLRDEFVDRDGATPSEGTQERRAVAAVALASLGDLGPLRSALGHAKNPGLRTRTIQVIARRGLAPRVIGEDFLLAGHEPEVLQAALLAWAETPRETVQSALAGRVSAAASGPFSRHPDPGVHSAADLLLRRWEGKGLPVAFRPEPWDAGPGRGWAVAKNGQVFALIPGPHVFPMGSPENELDRYPREARHWRRVERSLAVAVSEVTVEQYQEFDPHYKPDDRFVRATGCPASNVSWYDAGRFCNWMSEKAGIPRDQWCYPDEFGPGSMVAAGAFDRTGFRLPTEAEWELLCRAGTDTSRPFGEPPVYLDRYAVTWQNSAELSAPVATLLPNEFGLFDVLGNLWEWCNDGPPGPRGTLEDFYPRYPAADAGRPAPDEDFESPKDGGDWRIVRGGVYSRAPSKARSAHRDVMNAWSATPTVGFRVVRTLPNVKAP